MTRTVLAALGSSAVVLALGSGCSLSEGTDRPEAGGASSPSAAASSAEDPAASASATASPSPSPSPSATPTASPTSSPTASASPSASASATASPSASASPSAGASGSGSEQPDRQTTRERSDSLRPGTFLVDDARLRVQDVCRTGSRSFELFLEDGSRFYFDLLRGGSGIKNGQVFDPASFEDIRQVAPLVRNRGAATRVRVAGVTMRSDAGYEFDVAFLVNTADRTFCGE